MTADWLPNLAVWTPNDWTAFGTNLTALVAIAAGAVAWRQLGEARRLRKEQAQAYVVCYAEKTPGHLHAVDIVIRNFGLTAARDITVVVSPPLMRSGHAGRPPEAVVVPDQLPVLVPGQEWRTWWDLGTERVDSGLDGRYEVVIRYRDSQGKKLPPTPSVLDWADFESRQFVVTRGLHDAATALQEVSKTLKSFKDGPRGGVAAYVRDGDAADQRRRERYQEQLARHDEMKRRLLPAQQAAPPDSDPGSREEE
ncbi:hypothetical protein ACI8AC_23705 [Geodermatophilus sp. SYSU D00758]